MNQRTVKNYILQSNPENQESEKIGVHQVLRRLERKAIWSYTFSPEKLLNKQAH